MPIRTGYVPPRRRATCPEFQKNCGYTSTSRPASQAYITYFSHRLSRQSFRFQHERHQSHTAAAYSFIFLFFLLSSTTSPPPVDVQSRRSAAGAPLRNPRRRRLYFFALCARGGVRYEQSIKQSIACAPVRQGAEEKR